MNETARANMQSVGQSAKPYVEPVLLRYGAVAALTAAGSAPAPEGATAPCTPGVDMCTHLP